MNDLNLRVSGGIGEKVKKPAAPISMPYWNTEISGGTSEFFSMFLGSNSADNQLKLLKQFLNKHREDCDQEMTRFLVLLFWNADAKHPVKGFLKKHITDSRSLCQPFTEALTSVISSEIADKGPLYGNYIGTVTRLDACVDKFPPGATAVGSLEIDVATYLIQCSEVCIKTLGISSNNCTTVKSEPLAPTEINKIHDLVHLTLRLLLYMIQKVTNENRVKLSCMFEGIRFIIAELMSGKEVPMDTKSVSGIIYLTMHLFENGPNSWVKLLEEDPSNQTGTVNLSVYSAVATVVPAAELVGTGGGQPAVLDLTDKILELGDRYSSEASHVLAVARTVLAISKCAASAGRALVSRLARFCWGHMEHHVDSVRHLAAQTMGRVVRASVGLQRRGDPSALDELFACLSTLDSSRKSYYVTLTALAEELGGGILTRRPDVIRDVIRALHTQAVQACATTFLETLLNKHTMESDAGTIYEQWVVVILGAVKRESDPAVLHILERVLTRAVQADDGLLGYILPENRAISSYKGSDLKCTLLVLGVVRKSGVSYKRVSFEDLMHTAYDADDEIRTLALSLVAETPRSTEAFSPDELAYVLHFLDYNINAQSPSFRQLVLALVKKILKRLEDSYKVLLRKEREHAIEIACYAKFAEDLRNQCFGSLVAGGSYGRRCAALQTLTWLQKLQLEGWERSWTEEQADILYNLLEDSYENNKALALDVLKNCPVELIKPLHKRSYVTDALAQATSSRPCDCVAASYRLLLLLALPVDFELCDATIDVPERKYYCLLVRILSELKEQTARAVDIARAARDAPMYGLVLCLARLLACLDARAIAGNESWSALVADVIASCEAVNSRVASVVNAASPEGLLPEGLAAGQTDSGDARLADGRAITAQMLLLCAWRSVKETSLLLGSLAAHLTIEGEDPSWTLSATQVERLGQSLAGLLARLRHRGAFEQAYVGFTRLLARLWKCSSSRLHQLPLQWFADIERGFANRASEDTSEYCATRRGAGLPFMIQALVTTELAVEPTVPRGRLLSRSLSLCLRCARSPPTPEAAARAHLVLRALCRHAAPPAEAVEQAIMVAVNGFEADTWMERNSSTLLFSALSVRVFGVPRARDARAPSARNRMTGRIFFLRYPALYDYLLDQLSTSSPDSSLRPSLFPTLLLLARLYPSALEGTVSNLKLSRFLPHLVSLARARDAGTRRLAARAAAPLVPPHGYIAHIQSLLTTLGDPAIKRNLCHGLLCQLVVLLELKPELTSDERSRNEFLDAIRGTFWIAAQTTGDQPCYMVADEWLKLIDLILIRFPKLLDNDLASISTQLEAAVFSTVAPAIASGREIFLSNAVYLLLITSITLGKTTPLVMKCLLHKDYEVTLSALNYLLVLHEHNEDLCPFLEHLSQVSNKNVLHELERDGNYVKILCNIIGHDYLECKQKALKVLAYKNNTQKYIVESFNINIELSDESIIMELIDRIRNGHASLTSIYLESLLRFASESRVSLEVIRVLYECSWAGGDEGARGAAAGFLETRLKLMMQPAPTCTREEMFEWVATLTATAAILLEDDAPTVRQRAGDAVRAAVPHTDVPSQALPARSARLWRSNTAARADGPALLLILATLDFRADVETGDELGEECRVFDQNETHNVYLEEFTWTRDCAIELKRIYKQTYTHTHTTHEFIQSLLYNPVYKDTIEKLCIENVADYLMGRKQSSIPKIDLFLKILHK